MNNVFTPTGTRLMAVDLDGTLIRGNTLRIYIKCGISRLWQKHHYGRVFRILLWLLARRLRLVSHARMKFAVLPLIDASDDMVRADFTTRVSTVLNHSVIRLIDDWTKAGDPVLLATAAADVYVPWIWTGPFIATKTKDNPDHAEMRGQVKAASVLKYAADHGYNLELVLTDHLDDLPLMQASPRGVMLVNPTKKALAAARQAPVNILSIL